jgi:hypothetical protein
MGCPFADGFTCRHAQPTGVEFGDHVFDGIDQFFGRGRGAVLGTVFPSSIDDGLQLLAHGDDG